MAIDINKLNKVKTRGNGIIAQCPACFETGSDSKGTHLFVAETGQFGCVLWPGNDGKEHRKRIFELVGIVEKGQIRKFRL